MDAPGGVDWDQLLNEEMNWAMQQKQKDLRDEEFRMRVKIVGPNGEIADTPAGWRNEQEKRKWMWAVSETAKLTGSQAVVVISDARFLNVPNFCKRFGIDEPTKDFEEFDRRRREVMEQFGHYMGNLPRDCYTDSLQVCIRGPRVNRMATTAYKITGETIAFEPVDEHKDGKLTIYLIPAWWN